ncbi:MAG: hypothetical protein AB1Z98_30315 [Nannocystaceae bacterium]
MTTLTEPLVELHDHATRFLRDPERRVLHVVTEASLRSSVIELLRSLETGPHAPGPLVVLEVPHAVGHPGWAERAARARQQAAAWADPADAPVASGGELTTFANELGRLSSALPEGAEALVVVLAPAFVRSVPTWAQAVGMLMGASRLEAVRWVVVDVDAPTLPSAVVDERRRMVIRCEPAEGAATSMMAALAGPPIAGAPGARAPGVEPPRRPGAPETAVGPEALRRRQIAAEVAAAGTASAQGDAAAAVAHQRRARDLCSEGAPELAGPMELLLGVQLLSAGQAGHAGQSFGRAIERSRTEGDGRALSTALLTRGSAHVVAGDRSAALVDYSEAAVEAERAQQSTLAIEACRLTGDVAVSLGMDAQAIAFWSRGIKLGEQQPARAGLGSAGTCARSLALLCKQRGMDARAEQLWARGAALEGLDVEQAAADDAPPPTEAEVTTAPEGVDVEPAAAGDAPRPSEAQAQAEAEIAVPPLRVPGLSEVLAERGIVPPPSVTAIEEGTADLSVSELARMHWGGELPGPAPAPAQPLHVWTETEQQALRRTTSAVVDADSTALLSEAELFALHGDAPLRAAKDVGFGHTVLLARMTSVVEQISPMLIEQEPTAWLSDAELARRQVLPSPPEPSPSAAPREPDAPSPRTRPKVVVQADPSAPRAPGDETTVMSKVQLAALERRLQVQRSKDDD